MNDPMPHEILSVSQLNDTVRQLLDQALPPLWVEGEISNLAKPASGHLYFSLKDSNAQVRCAFFRHRASRGGFIPANGDQVRLRAKVGLYTARGEYQLIIEHLEAAGDGALQRAFEALRAKLQAEGLFDAAHKKPLPGLPKRIGVITSPTGAAVRDIISVLQRRCPATAVLIYPVTVQGDSAPDDIANAIALANQRAETDVLIVGRGGGSLEDLQAFNDERVARAIYASTLPVVSAVGHEVDVSIADWVADHRAATPSAAAEHLSPDATALAQQFTRNARQLESALRRRLSDYQTLLLGLKRRLDAQHPGRQLQERSQRLDDLDQRLRHAMQQRLRHLQEQIGTLSHRLHTISPLATLQRGYAIVSDLNTGTILREASTAEPGQDVRIKLGQGELSAEVKNIKT
ncbi:MAG: exodeoxyribonuclease VII large subunit [Gammaproteobacteria bacterium]|nr:exodeoxyribonuclease VII large subunit [Gammaproteobacteria bacterium]